MMFAAGPIVFLGLLLGVNGAGNLPHDLVSLMEEREVHVTHTTIMRWVFRYVPEYEKRWNRRAKPAGKDRRY